MAAQIIPFPLVRPNPDRVAELVRLIEAQVRSPDAMEADDDPRERLSPHARRELGTLARMLAAKSAARRK